MFSYVLDQEWFCSFRFTLVPGFSFIQLSGLYENSGAGFHAAPGHLPEWNIFPSPSVNNRRLLGQWSHLVLTSSERRKPDLF